MSCGDQSGPSLLTIDQYNGELLRLSKEVVALDAEFLEQQPKHQSASFRLPSLSSLSKKSFSALENYDQPAKDPGNDILVSRIQLTMSS